MVIRSDPHWLGRRGNALSMVGDRRLELGARRILHERVPRGAWICTYELRVRGIHKRAENHEPLEIPAGHMDRYRDLRIPRNRNGTSQSRRCGESASGSDRLADMRAARYKRRF